jgi:GAF domain-containing protein
MTDHLAACIEAQAAAGQPAPLYRAIEKAMAALVGFKLFTILVVTPEGDRVRRTYTNNAKAYPVGGFKPLATNAWGDGVIRAKRHHIGRNAEDIRWAFFDHELIASLGLASVLNMPIVWNDRCIGTMNMLDAAEHFVPAHAAIAKPFAQLLVPAMMLEGRG